MSIKENYKRQNKRVEADLDISTFVDNDKIQTSMRNLSCNGIMIADNPKCRFLKDKDYTIAIPVRRDKEVEARKYTVNIPIDDQTELKISAKVVWIKAGMIGLKFQDLDAETESTLDDLVLSLSNESES